MILSDRLHRLGFIDHTDMCRCDTSILASRILHAAGYSDAPNGRPISPNFKDASEEVLPRIHKYKKTEEYLLDRLDAIVAKAIAEMSLGHTHTLKFVMPNGLKVIDRKADNNHDVWVGHVDHAFTLRMRHRSQAAYANWRLKETATLLAGTKPLPLAAPSVAGNARLNQAVKLCHQALEIDPNLADLSGVPLRPLIETEVPELLRRHKLASQTAQAHDVAAIDAELEQGILRICGAIDEGLSKVAEAQRDALREQLAFLEMRHPTQTLAPVASACAA